MTAKERKESMECRNGDNSDKNERRGMEECVSVGRVESRSLPSRDSRRGEEEVESNVGLGAALGRLQPSQGPLRSILIGIIMSSAAHPARPASVRGRKNRSYSIMVYHALCKV